MSLICFFFFFQAEDGIRDFHVTGVQTCALPISDIEVSLLSTPKRLSFEDHADLIGRLRPGVDGIILEQGEEGKRATFLPQVWDGLSDPERFIAHLRQKAGIAQNTDIRSCRVKRYTVLKWREAEFRQLAPCSINPTSAAGGTCWRTGDSSATCARATAGCTKASAARVSSACASTTRWCSPLTDALRAFASTRWKRNRSTISTPARASSPSAPRAAISPASSARTGTFPSRATWTRSLMRRARSSSLARPSTAGAAASPSLTTTR